MLDWPTESSVATVAMRFRHLGHGRHRVRLLPGAAGVAARSDRRAPLRVAHMNRRSFLKHSSQALAGAAAVGRARPTVAQTRDTLSLLLTGDVILTRRVSSLTDPGFLAVRKLLGDADCTFGNCELVIADRHEGCVSGGPQPQLGRSAAYRRRLAVAWLRSDGHCQQPHARLRDGRR